MPRLDRNANETGRSGPDKEGRIILSSMHRKAGLFLLLGMSAVAVTAQSSYRETDNAPSAPAPSGQIAGAVAQWNTLRQSDNNSFSSYASFLTRYRGWPGEAGLRRSAERRLSTETPSPNEVIRFFAVLPATTPGGQANHALALQAAGRSGEAREAARRAWRMGAMAQTDETRLLGAFGGAFSPDDHDERLETLLGNGDATSAGRAISWARPDRRPVYEAQLALQRRAPDASARLAALDGAAARDPGLITDRAIWLRASSQSAAARSPARRPAALRPSACQSGALSRHRADPGARRRQRPQLADRLCDRLAGRGSLSARHRRLRPALWRAGRLYEPDLARRSGRDVPADRPREAARLFDPLRPRRAIAADPGEGLLLGRAGLGRSRPAGGGQCLLQQAAASPDQFYGQLAMERLGQRSAPARHGAAARRGGRAPPSPDGRWPRRRAISVWSGGAPTSPCSCGRSPRAWRMSASGSLAAEFGRAIGRPDLGVWVPARGAQQRREFLRPRRLSGGADPGRLPPALGGGARHHPPGKLVRPARPCLRSARAG